MERICCTIYDELSSQNFLNDFRNATNVVELAKRRISRYFGKGSCCGKDEGVWSWKTFCSINVKHDKLTRDITVLDITSALKPLEKHICH